LERSVAVKSPAFFAVLGGNRVYVIIGVLIAATATEVDNAIVYDRRSMIVTVGLKSPARGNRLRGASRIWNYSVVLVIILEPWKAGTG
jgi:hypothetical protein